MTHANPFQLLGGDLKGTLPNPLIEKDKAGLVIAGQVYNNRASGSVGSGIVGNVDFMGGAQWVGSSAPIDAGSANDVVIRVPRNCLLKEVTIMGLVSAGTCTVDIWKAAFGSFPPTLGGDITGGTPPIIASGNTYSNSTLSGWTKLFLAGDVLRFHLVACSIFTSLTVLLRVG